MRSAYTIEWESEETRERGGKGEKGEKGERERGRERECIVVDA